mgnify:CR=1 FL=1
MSEALFAAPDWPLLSEIFLRFLLLSLLATGGALAIAPGMHSYLVEEKSLLTDAQFVGSIALAQSAPGPNVLFVTVLGWQAAGIWGAAAMTCGALLPSAMVAVYTGRLVGSNPHNRFMKALREGLAPLAIGLTFSTGILLLTPWVTDYRMMTVVLIITVIAYRSKLQPIFMILAGALLGGAGLLG